MNKKKTSKREVLRLLLCAFLAMTSLTVSQSAYSQSSPYDDDSAAASSGAAASPQSSTRGQTQKETPERLNLDRIREKYWNRGDDAEFRVVQNRYYKKANKIELGVFGGIASSDPFLSIREVGGTLGYHFNEYFAFSALYMSFLTNTSSAYSTFRAETTAVDVNYNKPKQFYGGELAYSPIYGKLSLMGKMIIYYDLHLLGGAGLQSTENGKYFAPEGGIGQQIYLSKLVSIRLDYRMLLYSEDIVERQGSTIRGTTTGQKIGTRSNQTSVITLGATFLFGGG